MGTSYSIGCQDCGYTLELMQGVGMMFMDHERMLQTLSKKERKKVQALLEEEGATLQGFSYKIFSCSDCQGLESNLTYRVRLSNEEIFEPEFACSNCGGPLVEDDPNLLLDTCPECGSKYVNSSMGDWD